jgi:sortase A
VTGQAFALIRVPRFGSDYVRPVVKGTDLSVLDEGVGHYEGTAAPGEVGNFALAGHRVTYAKPFGQIAELRGATPTKRLLTMTACHPRYSAEQRYVVIAELAQSVPKTGRAPSVLAAAGAR